MGGARPRGARAAVGREQAGEQVERRRLAGAVRPEKAEHLAARDVDGERIDRHALAESPRQTFEP